MKTKYPSMFGVLAALLLVVSFIIPTNLASPSPVQAGICKWDMVDMPGSVAARADITHATEINKIAVGSDGATIAVVGNGFAVTSGIAPDVPMLLTSNFMGLMWSPTAYANLLSAGSPPDVFDVVIAPDNPAFWAVITGTDASGPAQVWVTENAGGKWESTGFTATTDDIGCIDMSVDYGGERDIAIGIRFGDGTGAFRIYTLQSAGFTGWLLQTVLPPTLDAGNGDVFALKFSPSYPADGALAVVYAIIGATGGTYYNVALRDIDANNINSWAFPTASVKVGDPTTGFLSPRANELISADLELPSDFNGAAASLRRAYVATDSGNTASGAIVPNREDGIFRMDDAVVYWLMNTSAASDRRRISSIAYFGTYASGKLLAGEYMGYACTATVPIWFTDSPTTCPVPCWYPCLKCPTGAACQDACLLGTEGVGNSQVVWFMDGQLAIAITGSNVADNGTNWWTGVIAAPRADDETALSISRNNGETWNQLALIDTTIDYFNDFVASADCNTLYLASANVCGATSLCSAKVLVQCDNTTQPTSCKIASTATDVHCACGDNATVTISATCGYDATICACRYYIGGTFTYKCKCPPFCTQTCTFPTITGTVPCAVTENITVTCACDCSPCCGGASNAGCCCFDSVWRSSLNGAVVAPLPPIPPVGLWYERVYTRVTALDCTAQQSDLPILRLAGACEEPTGQIVGWAAQLTKAQAWSPDYGDFWANISARAPIQDFAFESSTILYNLYTTSVVQKLPYTGTSWSTTLPSVNPGFPFAHMIAAMPEGQVLVGYNSNYSPYPAVISKDGGANFIPLLQPLVAGNIHVAFDPDYKNNSIVYLAGDGPNGSVYRNSVAGAPLVTRWSDVNMLDAVNGASGCPDGTYMQGYFGLALPYTGSALYAASARISFGETYRVSGVERTLDRLTGMPKPGIAWDFIYTGLTNGVVFTREPYSLKLCGCCTLDTDTNMYALDNRGYSPATGVGFLWAFTDCLAKKGPALITEDKTLIGCDPVSGRAGEVNLCWEQLCVGTGYDIEVSKNADFTIKVIDWSTACDDFYTPASVTSPCAYVPAGGVLPDWASAIASWGNLECGHTYYWRVQVRECASGQIIRSPWSEVRSFTVKAGYPVVSQYPGLQLLAPNNGSLGVPVKPVSFSWSPFGDATKYKFVLATDAAMTQVVKEAETTTTAYAYDGTLDYSTNYFWRVMAIEPAPSDWSATFSFQTQAAPEPLTPAKAPPTPVWVWVVIAIGAILVIVTLVLIFKTRRV